MNIAIPQYATFADVLKQLGNVPASRVRLDPHPGTATVDDVVVAHDRDNRLCELVDGVLVEKSMGVYECRVAFALGVFLELFLDQHDLGTVLGADGALRLLAGLVRVPDVSFISWKKLPGRKLPSEPVPHLVPDLAVEVLSKSNTPGEMKRKLREYFQAGVSLVWLIQPKNRTVRVYTGPSRSVLLPEVDSLDGGAVLPGFSLSIPQLFARTDRDSGQSSL